MIEWFLSLPRDGQVIIIVMGICALFLTFIAMKVRQEIKSRNKTAKLGELEKKCGKMG